MAWIMDQEIQNMINDADSRAKEILASRRHVLDRLAAELMREEVLEKGDIERIIGQAKAEGKEETSGTS
jgi:cell division protease FtsH